MDHVEITLIWFNFIFGLNKSCVEIIFLYEIHICFLNFLLINFLLVNRFIFWLATSGKLSYSLILNSSWIRSWVVRVFFVNFIFFFFLISSLYFFLLLVDRNVLDLSSRLDHIEPISIWFNFKFRLNKELNREISRLIYWVKFNNNIKQFFAIWIFFIKLKKINLTRKESLN